MDSLTIFYPAFNEEAYVQRAVEAAKEVAEHMYRDKTISTYEILIIDDASTDNTPRIADELAGLDPKIRCIHHEKNVGLGGAVKTGFTHAAGSVVLYSDIDLPFDMMEVEKAYRLMRYYEADIVTAFRFDRTCEGFRRLVYSKMYNALIMLLFGLRIKDVNFSFKLVRKHIFDDIELHSEGSFIDAELLAKSKQYGFHTIQFGTNYFHRSRGVSTLSSWSVIYKIIREMMAMRKQIKRITPAIKK
ncbi:MAG: glycosyltransferase family 2 protein [Desulfobacteraceae bacterium]|nr:glycosyltransferase family 2 protein [Desulfobacteraceae bacterium]